MPRRAHPRFPLHAASTAPHLHATTWAPDGTYLRDCPVYASACRTMRVYRAGALLWRVGRESGEVLAYATTRALHPATVYEDEWVVLQPHLARLAFFVDVAAATPKNPVPLADLGLDHFVRGAARRPLWFRAPDGAVVHSGAKQCAGADAPGRRYCHLCDALLSANNFVSQHLPQHADALAPIPVECDFENYLDSARAVDWLRGPAPR